MSLGTNFAVGFSFLLGAEAQNCHVEVESARVLESSPLMARFFLSFGSNIKMVRVAGLAATLLAVGSAQAAQKIVLPKPVNPLCQPTPTPVPTPKPTPPPHQSPTPTPTAGPTPKPTPAMPKPPANLPDDGPEPETLGAPILDKALAGEASRSYLPLWHGYPWQKIRAAKQWTAYLIALLKKDDQTLARSNPADVTMYCAKYPQLTTDERVLFWARFISVVGERESAYNPLLVTYEPTIDKGVFSTGFLQLSLVSARSDNYGCEMIRTQDDLFDWRKNLACSVRIMNYWMKKDGVISTNPKDSSPQTYRGLARYWQPLREARLKTANGRMCVDEVVSLRLESWMTESKQTQHPSYLDEEYKKAGEKKFEHLLRLVAEFPLCH